MRLRASWALVLLLIAALEFVRSYSGFLPVVAFALAVALPFALVRLAMAFGLSPVQGAVLAIVLELAGAWWALRQAGGTGVDVFTDAVPRLLTSPHPAPATLQLLAPAVLLTALVATVVALCVLAPPAESAARIGGAVAPLVGAAALYVAAQLLAGGNADTYGIAALSLVLITAAGWSVPYRHGTAQASVSWRPAVVLPALAVAFLGLASAAAVPVQQAFDPRTRVHPPTVHLDQTNPLALLASWTKHPDVEILDATVRGTTRLRLATLSDFTGASFAVDDSYDAPGTTAAPDLPHGATRADTAASVQIRQLGGVWLPSPGDPTQVSLPDALVDADNGGLARPSPVTTGLSYTVAAQVDAPARATLEAAGPASDVPARYTALPDVPSGIGQYARDAIRGASSPLEEAVAIENAVTTDRTVDPAAPTGTSYARLTTFLFADKGKSGAQVGTSEQFAAAFAVLARSVGLPTRVVVGFNVGKAGADGRATVHGSDAEAWPEVYFAKVGWVSFEPTPGSTGTSGDDGLRAAVLGNLAGNGAVVPVPPPSAATPAVGPITTTQQDAPASHRTTLASIGVIALAVLLALLLLSAVLRVLRRLRHRRRGAAGAWAEVLDLLVLLGRPARRTDPAPEIAAELDARLGTPSAAAVAAAADRAAFAPNGTTFTPDVWREVRTLRRRARSQAGLRRWAGFAIDPRPLLRRR